MAHGQGVLVKARAWRAGAMRHEPSSKHQELCGIVARWAHRKMALCRPVVVAVWLQEFKFDQLIVGVGILLNIGSVFFFWRDSFAKQSLAVGVLTVLY